MTRWLQGWLDITYLDPKGDFRLSRGNKGTLFVLTRDEPAKSRLLSALAARSGSAEVMLLALVQVKAMLDILLSCGLATSATKGNRHFGVSQGWGDKKMTSSGHACRYTS